MKAYVGTTGALFGLIFLAHLWRMTNERTLATDPWYLVLTAAAAGLCAWAWFLFRSSSRR